MSLQSVTKCLVFLSCLILTACESNLETTLREQKECKQVGGEPITIQLNYITYRGDKFNAGYNVTCKFKDN